jgi:hypothetical protein
VYDVSGVDYRWLVAIIVTDLLLLGGNRYVGMQNLFLMIAQYINH